MFYVLGCDCAVILTAENAFCDTSSSFQSSRGAGLGPLVCVGPVAVGPGPVENSEAVAGSGTVAVCPLASVLRGRLVLDVDAGGLYVTAVSYTHLTLPTTPYV